MIVSLLQLMGFPMGKPVHSRAEETRVSQPQKAVSVSAATKDRAQAGTARRQEVKANSGKTTKGSVAKDSKVKLASKAAKPVTKTAAKAVSKGVVAKTAPKPVAKVVAKKTAVKKAPPKPVAKPVAKPATKPVTKPVAKTAAKSAVKTPAKTAAKAVAKAVVKAPTKPAVKAIAKVPTKSAVKAPAKVVVKAASPVVKSKPTAVKTVAAPAAKAVEPVVTSAMPATASSVPVRSGRPSARLVQLTVPSMGPSVASTAAKASYTLTMTPPEIAPVIPVAIKKDAKLVNNWKSKPAAELTDAELLAMPDAEYMNEVQMAAFRNKLLILKRDILNSAGETTEHLREDTSVVPDPADRATIEEEHALELRTRDRERKLLKKIEQSIIRIDAGDYGYCDETGEAIGVGRLLARPTATLSLEAQQRRELKQKMFGD
jgi:DnaK suppressor protein